jgi:hypothetical protein
MNAIRHLVTRLYDHIMPPVEPRDFTQRSEVSGWTLEEIAEYNARVKAYLDRKEREQAAVRRELEAEERNMRRGTG